MTRLSLVLVAIFAASLAFSQAGPEQTEKTKPDTTKTEKTRPDTTKVEKKADEAKAKLEKDETGRTKDDSAGPSGHLKRALFTTAIEEHEPAGSVDSLSTAIDQVYFFTEIVGLQGDMITHRWTHRGEVRAEVPFSIGGPRWRVYSSKQLLPAWTGEWTVEVLGADGKVLGTKRLVYYGAKGAQ
jgi:hypothetical protein